MNEHIIKGIVYSAFSIEKASEGGWTKRDVVEYLKSHGIKSTTRDAYSPYVGQFGLWVEKSKEDEASKLLWGRK